MFKTLPPLTKIRLVCVFNVIISVLLLSMYIWTDPSFINKFDALMLGFVVLVLILITMLFIRIILVKSEAYGKPPGFLITADGNVYEKEPFFLKFPLQIFLVAIVMTQFPTPFEAMKQGMILGSIVALAVANIYYYFHLSWVYKNFPRLELPTMQNYPKR